MKSLLKILFRKLPRGLSEWLQGALWSTRAATIRLWAPLLRCVSEAYGGCGPFKAWPRGAMELAECSEAVLRPAGFCLAPVAPVARTVNEWDLESYADRPAISSDIDLVELEGALVDGRTAAVIHSDGRMIIDISQYSQCASVPRPWDHPIFYRLPSVRQVTVPGTVVLLGSPNAGVYFHWMLELFPKLALMKEVGMLDHDFQCLVSADRPFIRDSLAQAGVTPDRILFMEADCQYRAERLLTSTDLFPQASAAHLAIHLKKSFLPPEDEGVGDTPSILYISRKENGLRTLKNETDLIAIIRRWGGEVVTLEGMDLRSQARLFSKAKCVIAPHGSALTNLVFCKPRTKVLELFSPAYVRLLYPRIGTLLELDYWYLIGRGEREKEGKPQLYAEIDIDQTEFEETLSDMLS